MSTTKKRGHSEAFSDALSSYVTGNHLGKTVKDGELNEWGDIKGSQSEWDEDEYQTDIDYYDDEEDDIVDPVLINYLTKKYPLFVGNEAEYLSIQQQWLRIRPINNETPSKYKNKQTIIHRLYETYDVCVYNVNVVNKLVKDYKGIIQTFRAPIQPEVVISLQHSLDGIIARMTPLKEGIVSLSEYYDDYGEYLEYEDYTALLSEEDYHKYQEDDTKYQEEYQKYQEDIKEAKDKLNNITSDIFLILGHYQYDFIQPVLDKIRDGGKIMLNIPRLPMTTSNEHILILSVTSHGCHNTGREYPTFLALPDNIQICKTTLALPGETSFSLGEERGFWRNKFGNGLYKDVNIQKALQSDFKSSFTTINDFMRYTILLEIIQQNNCMDVTRKHINKLLTIHYRTWCDSVLNSTHKWMFHTRHGRYVKNKRFSLSRAESSNILEYGISVLYDSSGLFETGHQLINTSLTFSDTDIGRANITLQELMNELNRLNIWNKYGFLDTSCETGNLCLTSDVCDYEGLGVDTFRGGRKLGKKRGYTKKRKYTKK